MAHTPPFHWLTPGTVQFSAVFPDLGRLCGTTPVHTLQLLALKDLQERARLALAAFNRADEPHSEEVTQRFIVRVEDRALIDGFDPSRASMRTYLGAVMHMVACETLREHARTHPLSDEQASALPSRDDGPAHDAEQLEAVRAVAHWVDDLPAKYRAAAYRKVTMRKGVRPRERSTEYVHRHRAIVRLRRLVSPQRRRRNGG